MDKYNFDVIIIGGGPAGSVAGINLARSGLRTAIIERKNFPRDTLCGEFLSVEVINYLKESDLYKKFMSLNPNLINSLFIGTGHRVIEKKLPFTAHSIKRSIFDNFLLNEAVHAGVKLIQPAEVIAVLSNSDHLITRFKENNTIEEITSRFVIGAYGKRTMLDRKIERKFSSVKTEFSGIKFHLKKEFVPGINASGVYLFPARHIYCGINSVDNNEVTICFLSSKYGDAKSPKERFKKLFIENREFSSLFSDNFNPDFDNEKIYGAGNIYFGKKELIKNRILMVGDAAGVISPLAGDGIGIAFQSASMLSKIIIENFNRKDINTVVEKYSYEWERIFSRRFKTAGIIQNLFLNNILEKIPAVLIKSLIPFAVKTTRNW